MKRQIAGILTGLLVCSAFLAGCGKNEATQAVKESVETEKEGNGESTEAEGKDQDKNPMQKKRMAAQRKAVEKIRHRK